MERATTSFPTPVSPRMSTLALLRAAISMLRRRVPVVWLLPSSIADPITDFPIDRIFIALPGGGRAHKRAQWCARTCEHQHRSEMSRIADARTAILQAVGVSFKRD